MAFKDEFDKTQEEMGSSDFFKYPKDGDYKFRIMTEPVKKVSRYGFGTAYEGAPWATKQGIEADWEKAKEKAKAEGKDPAKVSRPSMSIKWMMWAVYRGTNKLVILELTNPVVKKLRAWMDSDEYGFTEFPMPYDITVSVTKAGTKEAEYDVVAARKNTEVTEEEAAQLATKTPVSQIIDRMKAKQREKDIAAGIVKAPEPTGEENQDTAPADGGIKYPEEEINPEDIPF